MATETHAALQNLLSRRSIPALQLGPPGPTQQQIDLAIDAALTAPDHGALRPLRLVLIRGAARERLSELFVRRMQEREPPTPAAKIDKARRMPLTAPLTIAAGAHLVANPKVPEIEQLFSAAAGIMNLLNAFHAQGFGAIWLTGANAYDPQIAHALQFAADERCLGFVYVGSLPGTERVLAPRRLEHATAVRDWAG